MKKTLTKLLIYALAGILIAGLVAWSQGLFVSEAVSDTYRILSDSFFIVGALMLAFAGLQWCTNSGTMDGLGYTFKQAISRMRQNHEKNRESYAEYRERKHQKDRSPLNMALGGLFLIAIAIVFLLLYSNL